MSVALKCSRDRPIRCTTYYLEVETGFNVWWFSWRRLTDVRLNARCAGRACPREVGVCMRGSGTLNMFPSASGADPSRGHIFCPPCRERVCFSAATSWLLVRLDATCRYIRLFLYWCLWVLLRMFAISKISVIGRERIFHAMVRPL